MRSWVMFPLVVGFIVGCGSSNETQPTAKTENAPSPVVAAAPTAPATAETFSTPTKLLPTPPEKTNPEIVALARERMSEDDKQVLALYQAAEIWVENGASQDDDQAILELKAALEKGNLSPSLLPTAFGFWATLRDNFTSADYRKFNERYGAFNWRAVRSAYDHTIWSVNDVQLLDHYAAEVKQMTTIYRPDFRKREKDLEFEANMRVRDIIRDRRYAQGTRFHPFR